MKSVIQGRDMNNRAGQVTRKVKVLLKQKYNGIHEVGGTEMEDGILFYRGVKP